MKKLSLLAAAIALGVAAPQAFANVTADKAAQLGVTLTPIGAEKAASKDGTVPAWDGGLPRNGPLKDFYPHPQPLMSDKVLFVVNHDNYQKYARYLTEGSKELLKRYPDYVLNVYPARRTVSWPDFIYAATKKNATTCQLQGTDDLIDCTLGFPFPIPTNGAEVIWNHKLKWRGDNVRRYNNQLIVQPDGSYQRTTLIEDVRFMYANQKHPGTLNASNHDYLNYLSETVAPPRTAGTFILVHDRTGEGNQGRVAWLYSPGLRRIRRAPNVQFDNPYQGTDGNQFYDQVDMFNGALTLYNWKLVGKREMIVGYNDYAMSEKNITLNDLVRPHHLNQALPRYEMHRVWVVEADLKPGKSHVFKKRVMYVDEDSWNICAEDDYDNRGQLYKYDEGFSTFLPSVQTVGAVPQVIYDFDSGRYFVTAAINDSKPNDFSITFPPDYFTPASVQKRTLR